MHVHPSKTHPTGSVTTRRGYCAKNPSGKDQLYPDEIKKISKSQFNDLTKMPCQLNLKFGKDGTAYDNLIAGWTQYWNEIFKPSISLDPNSVKALIAAGAITIFISILALYLNFNWPGVHWTSFRHFSGFHFIWIFSFIGWIFSKSNILFFLFFPLILIQLANHMASYLTGFL